MRTSGEGVALFSAIQGRGALCWLGHFIFVSLSMERKAYVNVGQPKGEHSKHWSFILKGTPSSIQSYSYSHLISLSGGPVTLRQVI